MSENGAKLDIEYKPFTMAMLQAFREAQDEPILPLLATSVNGVPIDELDSKTQFAAGVQVATFLATSVADFGDISGVITSDDGGSSES